MALGDIAFSVIARDQASKTFSKIGASAEAVEKKFGKAGSKLDKMGQASGKALALGLAGAGVAAVKLGEKASDLAETQSKVAQIFGGKSVDALDKFAASAAKNIGQSKQTALDAAATFGVFGKSAGLAGSDLVGFSTDMTKLASDMASFSNTSPEEAIEAIGAALRGESEPIRKYGVLLDDATLRNEALQLGLIKTTKQALTPQQKVLAAQAAIMKQTKDAQGDFARTSDGLANKQRILKAQMENLGAEVGAKVLPAMVKLTEAGLRAINWVDRHQRLVAILAITFGSIAGTLYIASAAMRAWTVISGVATAAQTLANSKLMVWLGVKALELQAWVVSGAAKAKDIAITLAHAAATVAAGVAAKAMAAAQWALNVAMTANPIGLVIAAIVGLVAAFIIAYKKSETFRNIVNGALNAVKTVAVGLWNWIKSAFPKVFDFITTPHRLALAVVKKVWGDIRSAAGNVVDFVKSIPDKLRGFADKFGGAGKALIRAFVDGMKNAAGIVSGIAGNVWNAVRSLLNGAIDKINAALSFKISLPGPDLSVNVPDIPHLAKGGIVTRPTLALIGEAGPEAVIPLKGRNARHAETSVSSQPLVVQVVLDSKVIWEGQRKLYRTSGGQMGIAS